jgi:quercetin dioxygenase-like cupin family protein
MGGFRAERFAVSLMPQQSAAPSRWRAIDVSRAFYFSGNRVADARSIGKSAAEHEPLPAPVQSTIGGRHGETDMRLFTILSAVAFVAVPPADVAAEQGIQVWSAGSLQWQESRPGGTQRSFLEGDPAGTGGVVTYAFHMPAGAWFPPHVHPTTARVFVLKGALLLGEGDVEDHSKVKCVEAGEVVLVPGSLPHYEGSEGDTIIIGITTSPFNTRFLGKH